MASNELRPGFEFDCETCSLHGECGDNFTCVCEYGWWGDMCETSFQYTLGIWLTVYWSVLILEIVALLAVTLHVIKRCLDVHQEIKMNVQFACLFLILLRLLVSLAVICLRLETFWDLELVNAINVLWSMSNSLLQAVYTLVIAFWAELTTSRKNLFPIQMPTRFRPMLYSIFTLQILLCVVITIVYRYVAGADVIEFALNAVCATLISVCMIYFSRKLHRAIRQARRVTTHQEGQTDRKKQYMRKIIKFSSFIVVVFAIFMLSYIVYVVLGMSANPYTWIGATFFHRLFENFLVLGMLWFLNPLPSSSMGNRSRTATEASGRGVELSLLKDGTAKSDVPTIPQL